MIGSKARTPIIYSQEHIHTFPILYCLGAKVPFFRCLHGIGMVLSITYYVFLSEDKKFWSVVKPGPFRAWLPLPLISLYYITAKIISKFRTVPCVMSILVLISNLNKYNRLGRNRKMNLAEDNYKKKWSYLCLAWQNPRSSVKLAAATSETSLLKCHLHSGWR